MFPQFYFLSNPQSQIDQTVQKYMRKYNQNQSKQLHRKQLIQFYLDQKYIDCPLSKQGYQKINTIKKQFTDIKQFDIVIVAPLKKCLSTAYQLFKDLRFQQQHKKQGQTRIKKVKIFIQPLLSDKVNGIHAIGCVNEQSKGKDKQQYEKYKQFFENTHILSSLWLLDILPQRVTSQISNNFNLNEPKQFINLFKTYGSHIQSDLYSLQHQQQFNQRIQKLKNALVEYKKRDKIDKKVLIIASNQTLNILAATGFHENGSPVNPLSMQYGSFQITNLVLQRNKNQGFSINIPFCS